MPEFAVPEQVAPEFPAPEFPAPEFPAPEFPAPELLVPESVVKVVFLKYDGRAHRSYPARWLGEDGSGTWLGVAAGTVACEGEDRPAVREEPYVLLVPNNAWWTAMFNAPPRATEIYCDVTTPATWTGRHEVTLVDLDLDVRRRRWGEIESLDHDEFAEHRVRFGYPAEVVAQATSATAWLVRALGDGSEPFATAFRPWLAEVSGAQPG